MSRVFTALHKLQGEISDVMLPMVESGQDYPDTGLAANEALVQAVLEGGTPVAGATHTAELPPAKRPQAPLALNPIRELPLRLPPNAPILPFDGTNAAAAEQYRIIRTKLIQHERQPRMLLVSSAGPADGKTVSAVNIAGALALKNDGKILLTDTDFRRSTIHKQLGLPASPGLADVLSGTATLEDALIRTEQFPSLYVISAGEPRPNPSELLDSSRWVALCNELRSRFAYVIADSPPVASVADYDLLQAACDGVILVARPDHTKRQALLKALEVIPPEKLIGVVMNCVEEWFLGTSNYSPYYAYHNSDSSDRTARSSRQK